MLDGIMLVPVVGVIVAQARHVYIGGGAMISVVVPGSLSLIEPAEMEKAVLSFVVLVQLIAACVLHVNTQLAATKKRNARAMKKMSGERNSLRERLDSASLGWRLLLMRSMDGMQMMFMCMLFIDVNILVMLTRFSYNRFSYNLFSYNLFSYNRFSYSLFSYNCFSYNRFCCNLFSYNRFSYNHFSCNRFSHNLFSHNLFSCNRVSYNLFSYNRFSYNCFSYNRFSYNRFSYNRSLLL